MEWEEFFSALGSFLITAVIIDVLFLDSRFTDAIASRIKRKD